MKKGVVYFLILVIGIAIGFAINKYFSSDIISFSKPKKIIVEKLKTQIIKDTVVIEKTIPVTYIADTTKALSDSTFTDSTNIKKDTNFLVEDDEIKEEKEILNEEVEEVIMREELIAQRQIAVFSPPQDTTDVSELLGLKSNAFSKNILVEFWESPLNITGYVLTRNRLKLFGFNPNESISLHLNKDKESLILNTETLSIIIRKTDHFKSITLR